MYLNILDLIFRFENLLDDTLQCDIKLITITELRNIFLDSPV